MRMLRIAIAALIALSVGPASGLGGLISGLYIGPGDVISGATAFWGLRCYTTAYTGNVADVWDAATGTTTETLLKCSGGGVLVATINPLATTCSGGCGIAVLYDQTGNGHDMTVAGSRFALTQNCLNTSLPCANVPGSGQGMVTSTLPSVAVPYTYSVVAERTANFTSFQVVLDTFLNAGSTGASLLFSNSANTVRFSIDLGAAITQGSVTDNAWHALIGINNSGAGTVGADNNNTTGSITSDSTANQAYLGQRNDGGEAFTGNLAEAGIWPIAFSAAQITAMCHNQFAYWGTSVSC